MMSNPALKSKQEQKVRTTIYNIDTKVIKDIHGGNHVPIVDEKVAAELDMPDVLTYNQGDLSIAMIDTIHKDRNKSMKVGLGAMKESFQKWTK